MTDKPIVGILMGSDSDLPVMEKSFEILKEFEIPFEVNIISAHRSPDKLKEYASSAYERGLRVLIAGAGGAAHLPGVTAAFTALPVIGVPIKSKTLNGVDSLYSIVQMPSGVPVATVAIDGAKNAGLLAIQILAQANEELYQKFIEYKQNLSIESMKKNEKLNI